MSRLIRRFQVLWVAPGRAYKEADVQTFLTAAEEDHDASQTKGTAWSEAKAEEQDGMLELAWSIAGEEPAPGGTSLEAMASLLYDDTSAVGQYRTHKLLQRDRLYFRQSNKSPPAYEPRAEKDVEAARKQLQQASYRQRC